MFLVDLVRVSVIFIMLLYASYTDWRERRVSDKVWTPFILLGFFINGLMILNNSIIVGLLFIVSTGIGFSLIYGLFEGLIGKMFDFFSSIPLEGLFFYFSVISLTAFLWYFSLINRFYFLEMFSKSVFSVIIFVFIIRHMEILFGREFIGGADLKALITIAVIIPSFPSWVLAKGFIGVPVITVLTNSLILGLAYPLFFLLLNLVKGDTERMKFIFIGFKVSKEKIDSSKMRLLEFIDKNGFKKFVTNSKPVKKEYMKRFESKGEEKVWVTYLIPFIVVIFLGFLVTITYGDLYSAFLSYLLTF